MDVGDGGMAIVCVLLRGRKREEGLLVLSACDAQVKLSI